MRLSNILIGLAFWIAPCAIASAEAYRPTDRATQSSGSAQASASEISIRRDFVSGPFGQIHVRIAEPAHASGKRPLVLFHPTPYSSDYFARFMRVMARDRTVIAIDTPGYGDSDRPEALPSIADYARSAAAALQQLGYDAESGSVDLLGYHTGCLIATELAALHPGLVRRLVLPGLPFFTGTERQTAYDRNAVPDPVTKDGSHLASKWAFATSALDSGLPLARGQEHFNDLMQCYPDCWQAYHAVFTYAAEDRFRKVTQPVLLITTDGSLKEETEAAMRYFPDARLDHLPGITLGGFDLAPEKFAAATRRFLDQ